MSKRVLVTGANGFVGRYVIDLLSRMGIDYIGIVRTNPTNEKSMVTCSFSDIDGLKRIIRNYCPDTVIHLAAIANPVHGDVLEIYDSNVLGTENLLIACRGVGISGLRFIMASTAGVCGNQGNRLIDEECGYNPANHYAYSKMIAEILIRQYADDIDACIVRPFNMIGAGQKSNFLVPKLVNAFLNRQEVLEIGNIETERDYIDVAYAAQVLVKLAIADNLAYRCYNICTGEATKGTDIIKLLSELTGYMPVIKVNEAFVRRNEIWRMIGNPQRMNELMGQEYDGSVKEILQKMLA